MWKKYKYYFFYFRMLLRNWRKYEEMELESNLKLEEKLAIFRKHMNANTRIAIKSMEQNQL